jgi:hypothetical protein
MGRGRLRGDQHPPLEVRGAPLRASGRACARALCRQLAGPFVAGISAAREAIVARHDDDRETFLRKRGFSKPETQKIIANVRAEEGRPPESISDFVQGITALARAKPHQNARLELEGKAARLMASVR